MDASIFFTAMAFVGAAVGICLLLAWRVRGARAYQYAGVLWVAYALWEGAVQWFTPEADIRVDLLLFYPVLAVASLWALVVFLRPRTP